MKNHPLVALLLVGFVLSACEDEHESRKTVKLDSYVESFDVDGLGFEPQSKVTYEYQESGKIAKYTVLSYNPNTADMEEQRSFTFSYSGSHVERIDGYLPAHSSPYVEYSYEYLSTGQVSKISEVNHSTNISSAATFAYNENGTVKIAYAFSNGGSFEYEFDHTTGNVSTDKTTRGSQLCSEGTYTYDQYKNPFNSFGYVDYLLTNLSANNKLTEDVSYLACAFPSLIPESYTYEYNEHGYPISATTFYKSDGSVKRSKKEFFYRLE